MLPYCCWLLLLSLLPQKSSRIVEEPLESVPLVAT
jgi:uncharacterized membrane protein